MMQVFIANIFYLSFFGGDFLRVCIYLVCLYLLWWEGGGCVGFACVVLLYFLVVSVWCAWCNVVVVFLM